MNFLPAKLEGGRSSCRSATRRSRTRSQRAEGRQRQARDVIAGMRPEHFEDANVAAERGIEGMKFKAKVEVVESMGSELYAYFDVKAAAHESASSTSSPQDAGLSELPGQGGETPRTSWRGSTPPAAPRAGQGDRAGARHERDQAVRPRRRQQPRRRGAGLGGRRELGHSCGGRPPGRPRRPGGSAARSIRSIHARSPTLTATASATCAGSPRTSTT